VAALGTTVLKECPESVITGWSREMVSLFMMCHAVSPGLGGPVIIPGPLPAPGGVLDQDNATMEAFRVIREEMGKVEKKDYPPVLRTSPLNEGG